MSSEQDAVEQLDRAQGQMMNALADAQEQGRTGWVTHAKLRRWMDTVGEAKQALQASQQENERLREANTGDGSPRLVALFELQDELRDVIPNIGVASGLDTAIAVIRAALEASQRENERYRTAFDWEGMRSWAESVRNQWTDYDAKNDDGFAYPALKLADKILEGLAALEEHNAS